MPGKHHHHKDLDAYKTTKEHGQQHTGQAAEAEAHPSAKEHTETSDAPPHEPATAEKCAQLEAKIADLQGKLALAEDKSLRLVAEFDNFRKRAVRERADASASAQSETLTALLPVLDHFELALASASGTNNFQAMVEGMRMIDAEFHKALKDLGVDAISSLGQPFDPKIHEAIGEEESNEVAEGIVCKQWRAGYKLGDRVIRPAAVIISKGASSDGDKGETSEPSN